jgi:hypothetical protein
MQFSLLALLCASTCCQAAEARRAALIGPWACGPITMAGPGFDVILSYTIDYLKDGSYREMSDSTVKAASGRTVKTRSSGQGAWTLNKGIIETRGGKSEFLSSDDPAYTVEMGQGHLDAENKKKNWSKSQILALDAKQLRKIPIEVMYKQAAVEVNCLRQGPTSVPAVRDGA